MVVVRETVEGLETAPQFRALDVLAEDLSSDASTDMEAHNYP